MSRSRRRDNNSNNSNCDSTGLEKSFKKKSIKQRRLQDKQVLNGLKSSNPKWYKNEEPDRGLTSQPKENIR